MFCFHLYTGVGHSRGQRLSLEQMHSAFPNFLQVKTEWRRSTDNLAHKLDGGYLSSESTVCKALERYPMDFPALHFRARLHAEDHRGAFDDLLCTICGQMFKSTDACKRHKLKHQESMFKHSCKVCFKKFYRKDALQSHLRNKHKLWEWSALADIASKVGKWKKPVVVAAKAISYVQVVLQSKGYLENCQGTFNYSVMTTYKD